MTDLEHIQELLARCTPEQRHGIFEILRREFPIHPIETKLNTPAEVILEAIDRASDLTLRGIRGVIAEAAFATDVVAELQGWTDVSPPGDLPYDFLLRAGTDDVRIQVKLQRQKQLRPMRSEEAPVHAKLPPDMFVVEVQRTRGGTDPATGESTRPYRYGEFDILAVSLHPSTKNWNSFMFTLSGWLIPRPGQPGCIQIYQPVAQARSDVWTDDLLEAISWLRTGEQRRLPQRA